MNFNFSSIFIVLIVFIWPSFLLGYMPSLPALSYSKLTSDIPKTEDEKLELFIANFIEKAFVKDLVNNDALKFLNEDDSESVGISTDSAYYNDFLVQELSKQLAQKDIFKLKRLIKKHLSRRVSSRNQEAKNSYGIQ